MRCGKKVLSEEILSAVRQGVVPRCRQIVSRKRRSSSSVASSSMVARHCRSNNNNSHHSSREEGDSPAASREPSQRTAARQRPHAVATLFQVDQEIDNNNDDVKNNSQGPFCGGVLKPAVTFFGETLNDNVRRKIEADRTKADALIVIGTSLSVAPISKVIEYLPANIPRILINRTIVHPSSTTTATSMSLSYIGGPDGRDDGIQISDFRDNYGFDAYLLGYCDDITRALARKLFLKHSSKSNSNAETIQKTKRQKTLGVVESLQSQYCGGLLTRVLQGHDGNWKADDWSEIKDIPPERVLLFPGALASKKNHKDTTSEEVTYREVVHCDGCTKQIEGVIQKCVNCFDFDLCSDCFPIISKTHFDGSHIFNAEA
jgi:Sir2 family/Zinc finger, ZZ type